MRTPVKALLSVPNPRESETFQLENVTDGFDIPSPTYSVVCALPFTCQ